jgi:hypothetical protein
MLIIAKIMKHCCCSGHQSTNTKCKLLLPYRLNGPKKHPFPSADRKFFFINCKQIMWNGKGNLKLILNSATSVDCHTLLKKRPKSRYVQISFKLSYVMWEISVTKLIISWSTLSLLPLLAPFVFWIYVFLTF